MHINVRTIGVAAVLLVAIGSQFISEAVAAAKTSAAAVSLPPRIIVKFAPAVHQAILAAKSRGATVTGVARVDSLQAAYGVIRQRPLFEDFPTVAKSDLLGPVYLLELPPAADIAAAVAAYQRLPEVVYAEPDYPMELFATTDDPLFSDQWYLNNTGQSYLGMNRLAGDYNDTQVLKTGKPDADIDAQEAFDSQGEMTIPLIGIIDTGVDTDHEDLAGNIWVNPGEDLDGDGTIDPEEINGVDDDHNGFVDDFHGWDFSGDSSGNTFDPIGDNNPADNDTNVGGHGTHCAGIAGAIRDNGIGISGIAGSSRIMALKIFPNAFNSVCARGITYAADMNCDVINMSWGGPYYSNLMHNAITYARSRGVMPIAAAGNSGREEYMYPAALPEVFAVGASNSVDQVTSFSTFGSHIRVIAPGEDILSLRAEGTDLYATGGSSGREPGAHIVDDHYYLADGTSMASPCVVGVAAYLAAASPGISPGRIMEILEASADDIVYPYGDSSVAYPGKDFYSGYGRINLNAAVQMLSGCLAKIDYPYCQAIVAGDVAVIGTASGTTFSDYRLEYGLGRNPTEWTEIAVSASPVSKDILGIWSTAGLGGLYLLRLTVGDGNQAIMPVILDNVPKVGITSPQNGDTILGEIVVYGNTIASGFVRYTLDYRSCDQPARWDTIITSTRIIGDDLLGSVPLNNFVAGDSNIIRLTVHTDSGTQYADSIMVYYHNPVNAGWRQPLASMGSLTVAVGDVNGDGYGEIITGEGDSSGNGGLAVFSSEGIRQLGWSDNTGENMCSCPAVGDLDGDGVDDIVISAQATGLHAYLSHDQDWTIPAYTEGNEYGLVTPVIADLENDGRREVLMVNKEGRVFACRNDGTPVFGADTRMGIGTFGSSGVAVADLDGDGPREVIVCSAEGQDNAPGGVYIFDIDGNLLLGAEQLADSFAFISGFAIANVDSSPDLEIIIAGGLNGRLGVEILKKDGSRLPGFPILLDDVITGWWYGTSPAVGDLEGDGTLEIVISVWTTVEARVYAWHQDGTPVGTISPPGDMTGSSFPQPIFAAVDGTLGSPILADINADGAAEILARAGQFFGSGFEKLMAWDYQGTLVPGYPLYATEFSVPANYHPFVPAIADLNRDDRLEMTLNTQGQNYTDPGMVSWTLLESGASSRLPWPSIFHDSWNSRILGFQPPQAGNFPPNGFRIAASAAGSVTLAWVPRWSGSSRGYNICRSQTVGEQGTKVNTELIPQPDSQYIDAGVTAGDTYYYSITNVDTLSQESTPSSQVEVVVGRPTMPTGLSLDLAGTIATLTWRSNPPAENIEHYNIYFKGSDNPAFYLRGSAAGDTVFIDSLLKPMGVDAYRLTAVNALGESAPGFQIDFFIEGFISAPGNLRIVDWLDTSVTLTWGGLMSNATYRLYRSTAAAGYDASPLAIISSSDPPPDSIVYTDSGLTRGRIYYYVATQIIDNVESHWSEEMSFLAGRPHVIPDLVVASGRDSIALHIACPDPTIAGYRIYRREGGGPFAVIDSLLSDTVYVDRSVVVGGSYYYAVAAVDTFQVEGFASPAQEGCLMIFDRGLLVVDMTYNRGLPGDTVTAFYRRALPEYQFTLRKLGSVSRDSLMLNDLSRYPAVIIHSDHIVSVSPRELMPYRYPILRHYLDAGGALMVEGRFLFPDGFINYRDTVITFHLGDFPYDYLAMDSAYINKRAMATMPFIGFVGAQATLAAAGYPPTLELDTVRTKSWGLTTYDDYQLGNVDYFLAHTPAEVLYTYVAADDTASAQGMPVAIRCFTPEYKLFWFTFPLYYIREDQAAQIVRAIMNELGVPVDVDDNPDAPATPTAFALQQNSPNPFNPSTTIRYALPRAEKVTMTVYNVLGQRVVTLVDGVQEAGLNAVVWDGRDAIGRVMASGIYFYRLEAGDFAATKKMVLLK